MAKCSPLGCVCGEKYLPQRYVMVIITALGIVILFGHRLNINLIITEMVKVDQKTMSTDCSGENFTKIKTKVVDDKYMWTESNQGVILAAFYIGYVPAHFPAGMLSDDYGARYIYTTCVLLSTLSTIVVPVVVKYTNWWVFAILRAFTGMFQGSIFPAVTSLLSRWIPKEERATIGGVVFAANSFGQVLGPLLTGVVQQIANSWEITFYFWAILGSVWYVFAMCYLFSDAESHPFITQTEKDLLAEKIVRKESDLKRNWKLILSDVPMWALVAGQFGHGYLIFFLSTNMPKYFKDVLHVNLRKNTFVSSLPYILQWMSSVASGKVGDWMIKTKHYNVSWIRKIYTTIASVLPSIAILIMPYTGCNVIAVTILLSLSLLFMGPFYCGLKVNVIDLTVNFAGLMMAIVNGLGAISGAINPIIVAKIAHSNTLSQWKVVAWVIFGVASFTNTLYVIWGSAKRSRFDYSEEHWVVEKKARDDLAEEKKKERAEKKEAKEKKRAEEKEAKQKAKEEGPSG